MNFFFFHSPLFLAKIVNVFFVTHVLSSQKNKRNTYKTGNTIENFVKTSWSFHENKIIKSQTIPCLYLASDRLRRPGWLGRRRRRWCTFLRRRRWGWCPSTALTSSTNCKQTEKTTCMYEVINTPRDEWMGYT